MLKQVKLAALGRLTCDVVHDVSNHLSICKAAGTLLQQKCSADEQLLRHCDQMLQSLTLASNVLKHLMAYACGDEFQNDEYLDMHGLIHSTFTLLQSFWTSGTEVHLDLSADDAFIVGNYSLLQCVLFNLSSNARDAMDGGGTLTIHTSNPDENSFALSLTDTGCGMEEIICKSLFAPFYTQKAHGHGLGLDSCRNIVAHHGGSISVKSKVGIGTTFTVSFPLSRAPQGTLLKPDLEPLYEPDSAIS